MTLKDYVRMQPCILCGYRPTLACKVLGGFVPLCDTHAEFYQKPHGRTFKRVVGCAFDLRRLKAAGIRKQYGIDVHAICRSLRADFASLNR